MAPKSSTHRIIVHLLSIMLALTALIMLTALVIAQEVPPAERSEAAPAASGATKRHLAANVSRFGLSDSSYGLALSSNVTSATGIAGTTIEYVLTLVNVGSVTDTFTLTESSTWSTTLPITSVSVNPATPIFLTVKVEVPAGAVPGDSSTVTVTATSAGDPAVSASVELLATAVAPPPCAGCDPVFMETTVPTGSEMVAITATEQIVTLTETSGLVAPAIVNGSVSQDPTALDPFDDLGDHLFIITDTVPAGALRLVAEILASESPDLDIYLGHDTNGDGQAQPDEVRCVPFSAGSFEYCSIEEPEAGVWWLLVQAYYASGAGTDEVTVAWAVVDENNMDNAALDISGPSSAFAGQPIDLDLHYDLGGFNPEPGDVFYGGVSLGTEPGNPGNIDRIMPVDVRYLGGAPQIAVTPDTIDETVPLGEERQATLTISNTGGDRPLNWQLAADGRQPAASRSAHEIVRDGSFELGSPNPYWHEGGDILPPLCSPGLCGQDIARTGEWYAWFGGLATTNTTWISQNVMIPNAQTALLSFYLFLSGNPSQEMGQLEVLIDGDPVATYDEENVADYYQSYQRASVDISAFADGTTHELTFVFDEINFTGLLDDVSIEVDVPLTCVAPESVPWLSLGTGSGAVAPGDSTEIEVHLDAGGLTLGTYNATLCIESDDADVSLHQVPVTLAVRRFSYLPVLFQAGE